MSNLLVTGGAGFIGANYVRHRLEARPDDRVVVLDALTYAGRRVNLEAVSEHPGFRFVHGDIRDRDLIERLLIEETIHTIVHFAAESHVDRSIGGPGLFVEVNVGGTQSLLEAARCVWLGRPGPDDPPRRFHHISTDEVYGSLEPDDPPCAETAPYRPSSPYAASKAAADHLVRAYHRTYGLPVTVSNCSNNYGPLQFPEKLIPLCLAKLLSGDELPIYGDGMYVRDWLHVDDHCRGIEAVLERGRVGRTYNIGGNCERTNIAVVRSLCERVDELFGARPELAERYPDCPAATGRASEERITRVEDRPGHDRRYSIDAHRIASELGFRPAVDFEDGLQRTVEWYVDNPTWWRSALRTRIPR